MPESGSTPGGGQLVPDYELVRRIGQGAYGEVWLARSKATGALRAAKIVWRNRFEDDRPFRREFEGIQRFEQISREHPSQLALFHIGRNDAEGYFYYVMELADPVPVGDDVRSLTSPLSKSGTAMLQKSEPSHVGSYNPHTLRADLEHGRLPAARVLEIGLALAEALAHLHQHGLVHRDVKPSNVIFVNGRPKLADIGLVTDASDQCSIVGTEGYLPPEGPGTPQADIFALGKVLYEAATGLDRREFPKLPADLRDWPDAGLVLELNEVVLRACAKEPDSRYSTCEEMHDELVLLERGKSVKRKRSVQSYWAVGRTAGIAAGVVAAIATLILLWSRSPAGRPEISSDGPDSTNVEANALCDKGLYILRGDNYEQFGTAYTNFHQAIKLDPNFARPYVGLLELRVPEHVSGLPDATLPEMRSIARRLRQLAPSLGATYCAKSVVDWGDWNFEQAERNGYQCTQFDPNYEFGHIWYGWMLLCLGRTNEARMQGDINLKLAPSKVTTYRYQGNFHYLERDYTNAIEWYQKALEWEPHHLPSFLMIGQSLQAMGDYTNSLDYLEKAAVLNGETEASAKHGREQLRKALDENGIRGYWLQQWKWTKSKINSDPYWKAEIQMRLGNTNAAFDFLRQSYKIREMDGAAPSLVFILLDDFSDGLRGDPRFKALLDEMGFSKAMIPRK